MNYAVILKPSGITRATVIAGAFRQVACRSVFQIFPVRLCHFAEAVTPRPFEGGKCTATPQQWNHKRCSVNPPMLDPLKVSFQNRLAKLHLDLRPGKTAPSHPGGPILALLLGSLHACDPALHPDTAEILAKARAQRHGEYMPALKYLEDQGT